MFSRRRRELEKLTDAELAQRLDQAWADYETADKQRRASSWFWKTRRTQDLPLPYRFWEGLVASSGFRVIAWAAINFTPGGGVGAIPATKVELVLTEIDYLLDEVRRRVRRRKART